MQSGGKYASSGSLKEKKNSPNAWRWQQHADWVNLLQRGAIKNVSIPVDLWRYLGDYQFKVTRSYTPARWGDPDAAKPTYDQEQLQAIRLALDVFDCGKTKERREALASVMAEESAMKHRWFRALIQEIRAQARRCIPG